ncbi:NAD(P)/FAD-dependent oxidoreductase [Winogradskyella alexanderae]|uniref:FAD-dependent oxidoreductase n=1 Tax=Winogradskyella alexanderae TaxID=2877123 RepID=A0ABS7XR99_9FLAO|nr:FAD-dependent oxidoreductase [Winogradskyella alexanderae]MCA0132528.1 FAD-dependent oxidoreductase [Winogradskyella alexanderae]
MSKKVIVIGGGIIGLCSAYFLQKEGHEVTVIDKSGLDSGASYVNAGYLSPSHIIPLSAPGVVKKGLKWMLSPSSPFYVKPRMDLEFLKWAWAFNASCNSKHVERTAPVIRDITILSQRLFEDIIKSEKLNAHYKKKGLIMLCQTQKMLEEEIKILKLAQSLGLEAQEYSIRDIESIEPNVKINSIGGTYYKCDHHSTPHEFMTQLKTHLKDVGVTFRSNDEVVDFKFSDRKITNIITTKFNVAADEFVLASGSWTAKLVKKMGLKLLLQAGKGYRIDSKQKTKITVPAILAEAKVAVTPMNGFTRFAGTMEIAGINHNINKVRVEAISRAVKQYYPNIEPTEQEKSNARCGLRPVSPDGLPYIGKSSKFCNLTIAAGHAMMGWSMGTATGLFVAEIISDKKPSLDLKPFHPERQF